jgi:hypothetical protein
LTRVRGTEDLAPKEKNSGSNYTNWIFPSFSILKPPPQPPIIIIIIIRRRRGGGRTRSPLHYGEVHYGDESVLGWSK